MASNRRNAKDLPFSGELFRRGSVFELLTPEACNIDSQNLVWGKNDPLAQKNTKFRYDVIHQYTDSRIPVKFHRNR